MAARGDAKNQQWMKLWSPCLTNESSFPYDYLVMMIYLVKILLLWKWIFLSQRIFETLQIVEIVLLQYWNCSSAQTSFLYCKDIWRCVNTWDRLFANLLAIDIYSSPIWYDSPIIYMRCCALITQNFLHRLSRQRFLFECLWFGLHLHYACTA